MRVVQYNNLDLEFLTDEPFKIVNIPADKQKEVNAFLLKNNYHCLYNEQIGLFCIDRKTTGISKGETVLNTSVSEIVVSPYYLNINDEYYATPNSVFQLFFAKDNNRGSVIGELRSVSPLIVTCISGEGEDKMCEFLERQGFKTSRITSDTYSDIRIDFVE